MESNDILALTYYRGRVGLYAVLKALGIGRGDEVATQAFTCLAVPEGIMATGAAPRFVDIETDGFNIDPRELQRRLTPATRAIVVQHTFGVPAQLDPILDIARRAGLPVIEDCCHTLCSRYRGQTVGHFGVASFYSFEWGKPIVAGIGGGLLVHDGELRGNIERAYATLPAPSVLRQLKVELQYAMFSLLYRPSLYWPLRTLFHCLSKLGMAEGNYNPVSASGDAADDFGRRMSDPVRRRLAKRIGRLAEVSGHARRVAAHYRQAIWSSQAVHPQVPEESDAVFARYPLRVPDKTALTRKARERNVELAEWYMTPVHPLERDEWRLVNYEADSCPHAEARAREVVSLPTHPRVGRRFVERAAELLNGAEARPGTLRKAA